MAKLTAAGAAALNNAAINGIKIPFVYLKVGDGNGSVPNFTGAETGLVHQVDQVNVTAVYKRTDNPNYLYVEAVIPWANGGYTIREAAATDANGVVLVIGSYSVIEKPASTSPDARQIVVRLVCPITPAQSNAVVLFETGANGLVISTSGVLPIGSVARFAYSGPKFFDESNLEWLLVGMHVEKGSRTKAKNMPGLRAFGRMVNGGAPLPAGLVTQVADDGGDVIVVACSNATHVGVSRDGGDTFVAVPHNHPQKVTAVAYVGGQFILGSNSTTAIQTSYSTDGAQSFSAVSTARTITNGVALTCRGASNGVHAAFCAGGAAEVVFKTSGAANISGTLPAALNSSYIPMIAGLAGAIIFSTKNTTTCYSTANAGTNWATRTKPGSGTQEDFRVAMGLLFYTNSNGFSPAIRYTSDFVTWVDLMPSLPEPLRSEFVTFGASTYSPRIHPVSGGVLLVTTHAAYFSPDLVNWNFIRFTRTATDLSTGGTTPQYFCFRNLVMSGYSVNESQGGTGSYVMKVDYSEPDYIGMRGSASSFSVPDSSGANEYVRIS